MTYALEHNLEQQQTLAMDNREDKQNETEQKARRKNSIHSFHGFLCLFFFVDAAVDHKHHDYFRCTAIASSRPRNRISMNGFPLRSPKGNLSDTEIEKRQGAQHLITV
ncbi:hypothetical protein ACLOJK_028781 [Asimina triloba]